eukprot:scaffold94936_cov26-Tisochrysis_lutea.AAC.1
MMRSGRPRAPEPRREPPSSRDPMASPKTNPRGSALLRTRMQSCANFKERWGGSWESVVHSMRTCGTPRVGERECAEACHAVMLLFPCPCMGVQEPVLTVCMRSVCGYEYPVSQRSLVLDHG